MAVGAVETNLQPEREWMGSRCLSPAASTGTPSAEACIILSPSVVLDSKITTSWLTWFSFCFCLDPGTTGQEPCCQSCLGFLNCHRRAGSLPGSHKVITELNKATPAGVATQCWQVSLHIFIPAEWSFSGDACSWETPLLLL